MYILYIYIINIIWFLSLFYIYWNKC